jgi:UDP-N-acetylglucosamine:LPS N-acetylglucosamine transferase
MNICVVCSNGGHLLEALQLEPILFNHNTIWITFKKEDALSSLSGKKVWWAHYPTQRNIKNLFLNFIFAFRIFISQKVDVVISTGAGVAIPFFVLGKIFNKKLIYIESLARINSLSLTGKAVYGFCDLFLVQWPELVYKYPKAQYQWDPIFI